MNLVAQQRLSSPEHLAPVLEWERGASLDRLRIAKTGDGQALRGIAPVLVNPRGHRWHRGLSRMGLPVASAEMLGDDLCGALEIDAAAALLRQCLSACAEVPVVRFAPVRQQSHLYRLLTDPAMTGGWRRWEDPADGWRAVADCSGSIERYLADQFDNKRLRDLRREGRRLEASLGAGMSFERFDPGDDLERWIHGYNTLRRRASGRHHDADEITDRCTAYARAGIFRGYLLSVEETPVAVYYCLVAGNTLHLGGTYFDPALAQRAPGKSLLLHIVDDAHRDPAIEIIDLGYGNTPIQRLIATALHPTRSILLFADTTAGRAAWVTHRAITATVSATRSALRQHDEVVPVDDLVGKAVRQFAGAPARDAREVG